MSVLILPRAYISYSAADTWYKNKDLYRARYYYPSGLSSSSVQMDYGKEVANLIKDFPDDPRVAHIPKYNIRDEGFTVDISGVSVLMYPDTLDDKTFSIREYKTSEWVEGKPSWTQKMVDDHMQIKLYSLGVKIKYGAVNDLAHLDWLPTKMEDVTEEIIINGRPYKSTIQIPKMTGEVISFPCVVSEIERYRAREWIVQAANEISQDYSRYLKNKI